MTIVGIDCATLPSKTGLSFATYLDGILFIEECLIAHRERSVTGQIHGWLQNASPALIAMDSPLGWPAALGNALAGHNAGKGISANPNKLFRRKTDEVVREKVGKAPLEVGADRIARTAVAALAVLVELGELLGREVPILWHPQFNSGVYAIEVYPAGTLRAYERLGEVSKAGSVDSRKKALLKKMEREGEVKFRTGLKQLKNNEHVTDSVICAVAARDFLDGRVIFPSETESVLARKEGWIWVRDTEQPS